ncbi:hypothetical protein [Sphingomonas bacterium]|uniref:hypothetical protein n=1 Tax=Sphingomonas bacterium TaxID=1895847 RepID=UPI00260AB097|nr:hypothetical protein [Sphingomonas bacterium]MDB5677497.1 hypothetical protein [Sphingomonas bacterium]
MHAFDYISVLLSFVFAAAVTHVLATAGDITIGFKRVDFSWLNAGWMFVSLLSVTAWWIGVWDLRGIGVWSMPVIGFFFTVGCLLYLLVRLVCPRIPSDGPIDLESFHRTEGRKYISAYFLLTLVTIGTNSFFSGGIPIWVTQNYAVVPMALASLAAAVFASIRWVQTVAIVVIVAMWVWYFVALQPAMTG